ncbi:MAG: M1 family metallopeptidase [Bacteroidales bacterium]|nr:M1 family metallopeptidase [Bacteroidales bacterium]
MKSTFLFFFSLFIFPIFAQKPTYRDSVDVTHYHIHLDLSDLKNPVITGKTILNITPKLSMLQSIALDLQGLQTDSILCNKKQLAFIHKKNILRIALNKPLKQNDTLKITVFYHGKPQKDASWGGFFITGNYAFNYGIGMAAVPPNFGRVWYPCIDNFTDRATYEYSIKVKKGYKAACPGTLQEIIPEGNNEIWHWKLRESIPTYLSSVAVSDYNIYKDTVQGIQNTIPIEVFINKNEFEQGKKSFIHVKDFLHAFENAFGPYVWEKIGYVSTPFKGGAMEHATNIAYGADCNGSLKCENTLAHELSHHWFGNLVTCRSEKDMWLNEGWTSYSEAIFREYLYGEKDFKKYNRQRHKNVLQFAHLYDGGYLALYGIPHDYTYGYTIYKKGADVAHALRGYLGDSLFFKTLKQYFIDYAFKDISVAEFRNYLSKQTGIDLTDFFDFWVFGAGFPHFSTEYFQFEKQDTTYKVSFKINQRLKIARKYLNTPLEIGLLDKKWKINKITIPFSGKSEIKSGKLNYQPLMLLIDPDEKIPDATTDEYRIVKKLGTQNFNEEFFDLQINSMHDSAFVYVIHHWMVPKYQTQSYDVAQRYWTINYVSDKDFSASAKFYFDLSYALDNNLAKYVFQKLVLMYRENPLKSWTILDTKAIKNNRKSFFELNKLQNGEYTIGILK